MVYLWRGEAVASRQIRASSIGQHERFNMQNHNSRFLKKILVIAPYQYLPYFSGGQKSIAQFLDHLGKETKLTVVSVAGNNASFIKTYLHLGWLKKTSFSRYFDLNLVAKLSALIKKERFDAIIWEHPYYAWLAAIIKRRTGVKTILHIHNIEYQRFNSMGKWWWWLLRSYEKWFFREADQILFVSPDDKKFAIEKWKIDKDKCIEVAFGVEISSYPADKNQAKETVMARHNIQRHEKVLLFNGLLDYRPNVDALMSILKEINPLLLKHNDFGYKIIICGKRLPAELNELKEYADKNIIYAGFVDNIELYFKAADLFLNPVQSGGGIKTKMVEAIAFGTTVITTETGAMGIHRNICGQKLIVVTDDDWIAFARAIFEHSDKHEITPSSYYEYYYWGSVVKMLIQQI